MHTALNHLDADLTRYRALNAALAGPLPHLEIADRRSQRDRRATFRVPHLDADARHRAACNEVAAGLDRLISNACMATAAVAGVVGLGAATQVVALYVGGVL